jgi:hypothetical protein
MSDKIDRASENGRQQFDKAANPPQPQQGIGSEQVKNSQPFPQPTPPGSVRNAQDRITHQQAMNQDHERAMKVYEAAKARKDQQKQVELDKGKDKDLEK